ncbi:hypothetical protein [Bifidobacterium canis]|uniref:Uncharacterized protein n=1 Tax=Bifidobacterium canis TaxID=2610880 RepID=A0A7K1J5Q2_9BIFI|nr:hypothetical protein [Bifidobacterium canis]MUH59785.1 hypothetical protein [Bifidobacterium canis]
MRLRSILSESLRNIGSGTAHAFILFLGVLLCGVLFGGYEAYSVIAMEREALTRVQAMADVDMVVGAEVDGAACDRLATSTGGALQQSGAVRAGAEVAPVSTPGKTLQTYEVTAGMLALVASNEGDATVDTSGIWVPTDVATDFGLSVGSLLHTDHGSSTVSGIYDWPNDGRDTRFAYTFLIPQPASAKTFSECWVRQWPRSEANSQLLYATLNSNGSDERAGIMSINKGFDAHYNANAAYMARITRWIPYLALMLGVIIGIFAVRRRRLEYAGALHSGETKGAQLLTIGIETIIWAGLGSLSAFALINAYCLRMAPADAAAVIASASRAPLAVFAGALLASIISGTAIRQSQLFKLFKQR